MRPLYQIAAEIRKDWKKIYFGAAPYLDAMGDLDKITDKYFEDSASSIVNYFLANAQTWRGEVAKRVKKELNDMVKASYKMREAKKIKSILKKLEESIIKESKQYGKAKRY